MGCLVLSRSGRVATIRMPIEEKGLQRRMVFESSKSEQRVDVSMLGAGCGVDEIMRSFRLAAMAVLDACKFVRRYWMEGAARCLRTARATDTTDNWNKSVVMVF